MPVLVAVLVVIALVIGVVAGLALTSGDDVDDDVTADDPDPTDDQDTSASDPVDSVVSPSDIPVVVANGSGVAGAAGAVTDVLVGLGYPPGAPTDTNVSTSETPLDTVYYVTSPESFEVHAQQVAVDLGLPVESVLPMPTPPPVAPEGLGLAGVLVVLGSSPGGLATTVVVEPEPIEPIPGTETFVRDTFTAQVPLELSLVGEGPESDGRRYVMNFVGPGDIDLLIDTTPGYSGSATEGCRSVLASSSIDPASIVQSCAVTVRSGREIAVLEWRDADGTSIDAFFTDDGNGYAVLVTTAADTATALSLVYRVVDGIQST